MPQNIDLEINDIKKFIASGKQERYLKFISTPKNRDKFIRDLAHFDNFKWNLFDEVVANEAQVILAARQKNKISTASCYIISENDKLDTMTLDATEAIQETIGYGMGTILVFGNADIIFYEGESKKTRYITR